MFQKLKNFAGALVDASKVTEDNNSNKDAAPSILGATNVIDRNSPPAAQKIDAVATGKDDIIADKPVSMEDNNTIVKIGAKK